MSGGPVKLTDAKIRDLKASQDTAQMELADSIVPGLRVRWGKSGHKTFILRKRIHGKQYNMMLGRFGPPIESAVQDLGDGSLAVIFRVNEEPALAGLRFAGNKAFTSDQLLTHVVLRSGDPIDRSLIDRGIRAIEQAYEDKGYFATTVSIDEDALTDRRELVYTVVEGPKVRIQEIRFEGNTVFRDEALRDRIRSEEAYVLFFKGHLNRTLLDFDVAAIRQHYQNAGYLEADVGRTISMSPNMRDAVVTFQVKEGPRYIVDDIEVRFSRNGQPTDRQIFQAQQVEMLLALVRGGVFTEQRIEQSEQSIRVWYGRLGYINVRVGIDRLFDRENARVDVVVSIDEGTGPTIAGTVTVIGNSRTKIEEVLHRINGVNPGRPIDYAGLELTRALVRESTLFTGGTVTLLGREDDPVRDILIEIGRPADPEEVAGYFKGRRTEKRVEKVRELVEGVEVFGWG